MKLKITLAEQVISAKLSENPSCKALVTQLPLQVKMEDYAGNEKIFYLPQKLTLNGAPEGYQPQIGDITYYAPWGNLAVFYKDFSYSKGLIYLGKIISGLDILKQYDKANISIELVD